MTGATDPGSAFRSMGEVMQRDARDTRAAVGLAMAQPVINSQLIDNLNASIHFPGASDGSLPDRRGAQGDTRRKELSRLFRAS